MTDRTRRVTVEDTGPMPLLPERSEAVEPEEPPVRNPGGGLRLRVLTASVSVLVVALLGSALLTRALLIDRMDARIDDQLTQEVEELRRLAGGLDPVTGEPFGGDVARLFEIFLQRNIPSPNEMFVSFVDRRPFLRTSETPYRLDLDETLAPRWARLTATDRDRATTPVGEVDYLAVPLLDEGRTRGTFVVAIFRDLELAEVDAAVRTVLLAGLIVLVLGSLLAWRLAEHILKPVRALTDAASSISDTELERRIDVTSADELGTLARTVNSMLDRLSGAFETQRRFVDDAGHELRTPLTAVRGHLEVMGDDPEDRKRTLELVLDELDRMARIVDDLLLLARAERPDFVRVGWVDVDALLRDVTEKVRPLGDRRWVLNAGTATRLRVDGQRLTQAMLQLVQNAVTHTRDGDTIEVGGERSAGSVRLWVRDEGDGIPRDEIDRIFERFHRVEGIRRGSEGAGLGLSIVRAIAEAHGGDATVTSHHGAGSTFAILIPAQRTGEADP